MTQSHRLIIVLICLGVSGSIVAMIAGYGLARMISRSLFQLHIPMQDLAGKLSEVAGDVVVSGELDLNDLGPVFQKVADEVTSVVEQLHARHQEIQHADQLAAMGQLAAGIAHEIRNPLMSMKMLVQSARGQEKSGLNEVDLKILDDEIRRLETLLNEFLDFARPRPLEKSIVDLGDLTESVLAFLQPQADARNVSIEFSNGPGPLPLLIDAPRIRQVLLNLLLNGIQVTPPGGVVRVALEAPGRILREMVANSHH
ncbi:MAG: histidine kinase dimerization/phospho-acceptor domain-containing protein [Pirellulales bacterium]